MKSNLLEKETNEATHERKAELDLLKVLAFFCVVSLHICAVHWYEMPVRSRNWQIINFLRGTWCVPVFVMITGRLLLDSSRNVDGRKLKRYIKRIVSAFLIWSVIYLGYHAFSGSQDDWDWKTIIVRFFAGEYHMWYLYMLAGLYLITPFLRMLVKDQKLTKYFLTLFFVFECFSFCAAYVPGICKVFSPIVESMHMHFPLGYTGYFVLGYFLYSVRNASFWEKYEKGIYWLGLCVMLLSGAANGAISIPYEKPTDIFTKYEAPNVILYSAVIYLFFLRKAARWNYPQWLETAVQKMANYGLGAYLVHVLVIDILVHKVGISELNPSPIIMVPVLTLLVAIISYGITAMLAKIPFARNYMM